MRILIEDHVYQPSDVKETLEGIVPLESKGTVPIHFVGYLFNKTIGDCVFFLPKVVLDEQGLVFHKYTPEQLINLDALKGDDALTYEQRMFLYKLSVWVYQAVNVYNNSVENIIVKKKSISETDFSANEVHATILDNILAVIKFAESNKDMLLFTLHNLRTGYNRINWTQTIARQQPVMRHGKSPIYLNPVNTKKDVDYEEELLVMFFSILQYVKDEYGFDAQINPNYSLIPRIQFGKYLNGYGKIRLREIKYKYFSDLTLKVWKLCYAFFAMTERTSSSSEAEDYLLASDFDRVFEAIIDDLIGQKKEDVDYPSYLKSQKDGKEIDHIFKYTSLSDAGQDIFFIGDSKYYRSGGDVHGNSEYKQYTYAKNVIQANIDLMLKAMHGKNVSEDYIDYRDEKTEGYNITPNFFISAKIYDDFSYVDDKIEHRKENDTIKVHFDNRLFDRDTLMLSHYDVNFLYVMTMYANSNDYSKEVYRDKVREVFRKESLDRLNERYDFYILQLKHKPAVGEERAALDAAINPVFRLVNGKILCPKKDNSYTNLILALEKPEKSEAYKSVIKKENQRVLDAVSTYFKVYNGYEMGKDIAVFLRSNIK